MAFPSLQAFRFEMRCASKQPDSGNTREMTTRTRATIGNMAREAYDDKFNDFNTD